jgi:hypothetical protein
MSVSRDKAADTQQPTLCLCQRGTVDMRNATHRATACVQKVSIVARTRTVVMTTTRQGGFAHKVQRNERTRCLSAGLQHPRCALTHTHTCNERYDNAASCAHNATMTQAEVLSPAVFGCERVEVEPAVSSSDVTSEHQCLRHLPLLELGTYLELGTWNFQNLGTWNSGKLQCPGVTRWNWRPVRARTCLRHLSNQPTPQSICAKSNKCDCSTRLGVLEDQMNRTAPVNLHRQAAGVV